MRFLYAPALVLCLSTAQAQAPAAHVLGGEETARRFLFCSHVYEGVAGLRSDAARSAASESAARSSGRASELVKPPTHDLLARMALDSYLEQIDRATRAGGDKERREALEAYAADCDEHLKRYGTSAVR